MPSSFSSATAILPSSMPNRLRNLAGTMIAPRFPTLADSINIACSRMPDFRFARCSGNIRPSLPLGTLSDRPDDSGTSRNPRNNGRGSYVCGSGGEAHAQELFFQRAPR